MKTKRLSSSLKLNKKTVANLSSLELDKAKGGLFPFPISRNGCVETLYSDCVVSYCCFTDPYAMTEVSCEIPKCAL